MEYRIKEKVRQGGYSTYQIQGRKDNEGAWETLCSAGSYKGALKEVKYRQDARVIDLKYHYVS